MSKVAGASDGLALLLDAAFDVADEAGGAGLVLAVPLWLVAVAFTPEATDESVAPKRWPSEKGRKLLLVAL